MLGWLRTNCWSLGLIVLPRIASDGRPLKVLLAQGEFSQIRTTSTPLQPRRALDPPATTAT
jgi:hypothetical protein